MYWLIFNSYLLIGQFIMIARMFAVDGGRRVKRPVSLSVIETEAGRRMSNARTSISDIAMPSSGRPSLTECGKKKKWKSNVFRHLLVGYDNM